LLEVGFYRVKGRLQVTQFVLKITAFGAVVRKVWGSDGLRRSRMDTLKVQRWDVVRLDVRLGTMREIFVSEVCERRID